MAISVHRLVLAYYMYLKFRKILRPRRLFSLALQVNTHLVTICQIIASYNLSVHLLLIIFYQRIIITSVIYLFYVIMQLSESETESSSEAPESDSSSIRTMPSESQATLASKSTAVRKAG